jgi:hypothetical protein
MKNKAKILLLAGLLSSTAFAEPQKDIYFGVGVNKATFEVSGNSSGIDYQINYEEKSYKALVGKRVNDEMSVELQYVDFAKKNIAIDGIVFPSTLSADSISVSGLYYLDPKKDFSPFAKLGMHSWDVKEIYAEDVIKGNGVDVFYGAGVDGKIDKYDDIKYRLEFENFKVGDVDFKVFSFGLLFDY